MHRGDHEEEEGLRWRVGEAIRWPGGRMPGDLAVWDGHVAMVVGNGIMIEARCQ